MGWVQPRPAFGLGTTSATRARHAEQQKGGEESQARFCRAGRNWESQEQGLGAKQDWEEAKVQAWRLPSAPGPRPFPGSQLEGPGCNKGVSVGNSREGGNFPKMLGGPRQAL